MSKRISKRMSINFNDLLLIKGKMMNDNQFEEYIRVHASDQYWKVLAERARLQLEDQLRDNRQLHDMLEELIKENEQLQMKCEQYEYLNHIFNSILSEYDNGFDLQFIDQTAVIKRE